MYLNVSNYFRRCEARLHLLAGLQSYINQFHFIIKGNYFNYFVDRCYRLNQTDLIFKTRNGIVILKHFGTSLEISAIISSAVRVTQPQVCSFVFAVTVSFVGCLRLS